MAVSPSDEIVLVGHSNVVYWWPAWAVSYVLAALSYLQGSAVEVHPGVVAYIHPSSNPGLLFIAVIVLLVVFTNARLRGIYSVVTVVSIGCVGLLFALLGWWDDILGLLPNLSARANMGFYLVFATALLVVWLVAFFIFDRSTFWRIRPGQIIEQRLIGGGEHSYDTQGLVFERRDQDFFRHIVLRLGAGDLLLSFGGARRESIEIPNVLLVDSKLRQMQSLVSIKPDQSTVGVPTHS